MYLYRNALEYPAFLSLDLNPNPLTSQTNKTKRLEIVAQKIGIPGNMGEWELNAQKEILRTVKDTFQLPEFLAIGGIRNGALQHLPRASIY